MVYHKGSMYTLLPVSETRALDTIDGWSHAGCTCAILTCQIPTFFYWKHLLTKAYESSSLGRAVLKL